MTKAVCSGSFDPVTIGHLDIFQRASAIFDELTICVFHNVNKNSFLPIDIRVKLIAEAVHDLKNVKVDSFSGLVTDYMHEHNANVLVRGVRSIKDLEYEQNEAHMVHHLANDIDTVFLLTQPRYAFISSSGVRELVHFGGSIHGLVPECVERAIAKIQK